MNADSTVFTKKIINIINQFSYCSNNPSMYSDPNGELLLLIYYALFMDKQGQEIFYEWLHGFGQKVVIKDEEDWNNYLMKNEHFIATSKKMVRTALSQGRFENGTFSETAHLDLSGGIGGGYCTGYDLINGTNADVGDFQLEGSIYFTESPDVLHVKARYTIHDVIDPNFDYGWAEKTAYVYCKLHCLWILGGYDYELEISGDIEFDVEW